MICYVSKSFCPDSRNRIIQANNINESRERQGSIRRCYDRRVGCDLIPTATRSYNNLGDVNNGAIDMALNDAVSTSVASCSRRQTRQRCASRRSSR